MNAIIVEDELPAVENLKCYLQQYPINIAAHADCISDALICIEKYKPEVVFLDIDLSGENGFDLLEKTTRAFKTIFVTAYDEYAVRAFEVNALDYILKPLTKDRIEKTIKKLFNDSSGQQEKRSYEITDTIFISNGYQASFIKLNEICYIEADSNYSKIAFTNNTNKVVVQTLKKWEEVLPAKDFVRVHRSYIINTNQIKNISKKDLKSYIISFDNSDFKVSISRRYLSSLRKRGIIINHIAELL